MPKQKDCPDIERLRRLVKEGHNTSQIAGLFAVSHNTAAWWIKAYYRCEHSNTAAASAIKHAPVWCPDCKQWVVLAERYGS